MLKPTDLSPELRTWIAEMQNLRGEFLPMRTYSEVNRRDHWAVRNKRTKRLRENAWFIARVPARRLLAKSFPAFAVVTLTRYGPWIIDDDNLRSALKPVRDGVADAFGIDDGSQFYDWKYAQVKTKRGRYGVRIEIAPL